MDDDQSGVGAGSRRPHRFARSGQERRRRAVERRSVQRVREGRESLDRRREALRSGRSRAKLANRLRARVRPREGGEVNARTLLGAAFAAFLGTTALASAQTVAIVGGTVYPVSGPRIQNGTVVIENGRIRAVGANIAIPH